MIILFETHIEIEILCSSPNYHEFLETTTPLIFFEKNEVDQGLESLLLVAFSVLAAEVGQVAEELVVVKGIDLLIHGL